jgi:hypothetical protein
MLSVNTVGIFNVMSDNRDMHYTSVISYSKIFYYITTTTSAAAAAMISFSTTTTTSRTNITLQFNSIQFLFISMLTQQPKGQLQSEYE